MIQENKNSLDVVASTVDVDYLELSDSIESLRVNLKQEAATRKNRDDELQAAISAEAQARTDGDDINASAIAQEASERRNDVSTLTDTKLDASVFAIFQSEQVAQLADMNKQIDGKMPIAPNDGKMYIGTGNGWMEFSLEFGDPFVINDKDCAVAVERAAYLPNAVWDIRPDRLVISESSKPGDGDSMFYVNDRDSVILR